MLESCRGKEKPVISHQTSDNTKDEKQTVDDEKLKVDIENRSSKMEENLSSTVYPPSASSDFSDIQKIQEKWTYILETVRAYNYSLEALLRSSKILECGENSVVIEVPYSFHQRILESAKSRDLLQSIFSDILGRQIKIATALGKRLVRQDELSNIEVAEDDEIIRIAAEIFNSETVN